MHPVKLKIQPHPFESGAHTPLIILVVCYLLVTVVT
jgi:hypothetical protein